MEFQLFSRRLPRETVKIFDVRQKMSFMPSAAGALDGEAARLRAEVVSWRTASV